MAKSKFLLIAAVAAAAVPATASVVIVGSTSARVCYEAADGSGRPNIDELSQCDRALHQEPLTRYETAATHVNRGIVLIRRGRIEAGIGDFDRALKLDPEQPEAYLNKGIALLRQEGRAREALPLIETALAKGTRRPAAAYYSRAVAHEELGDVPAAYRDYRLASEADPEWRIPRVELARFTVR